MGKGVKAVTKTVRNVGRGIGKVAKTAEKVGSKTLKTLGKGAEGVVKNSFDIGGALLKGDIKGIGKEGLDLLQSGKDIAKGLGSAALTANTGLLGAVGSGLGSSGIQKGAEKIDREGQKGINKYGDALIDMGANFATGGAYGLAQQAASGLSSGGLKGLVSGDALKNAAMGIAGSYTGINPNLLQMADSAAKGDLKGAALQAISGGLNIDPKLAKIGTAALTGDKGGLASSLASQFGAGDTVANLVGSAASKDKGGLVSGLASQFGAGDTAAELVGSAASGNKGKLLSGIASQAGVDRNIAGVLDGGSKGAALKTIAQKFNLEPDSMKKLTKEQFKNLSTDEMMAGFDKSRAEETAKKVKSSASKALDPLDFKGMAAQAEKDLAQMAEEEAMRERISKRLEAKQGQVKEGPGFFESLKNKAGEFFSGGSSGDSYQIQKGDTFNTIAKKLGVTPEELRAANPNLTDINKISAGANLNLPKKEGFFDKAGKTFDSIKDSVKGAPGAIAGFAANNPNLTEGLIQGAGAFAGYKAADKSAKQQQEILARQEAEANQIREMEKFQFDPRRSQAYDQSYGFQQDIISQGGYTAAEKAQQKADDLRAAKMRQAAKMAGERTLAEKGQGSTGSGQAYASMLAGQQEAADVGTQLDLSREKQAAENLRGAYKELPEMMERKSQSEVDLAQRRSSEDVNRATQLEAVRRQQASAEQLRGEAMARLAGAATDTASKMVKGGIESFTEAQKKKEAEAKEAAAKQQIPTIKTPSTNTKAGAAAQVAGAKPSAEMATGQFGSGAGVLLPQYLPNAGKFNDALSKAPAPVQQAISAGVDKAKEAANKLFSTFKK